MLLKPSEVFASQEETRIGYAAQCLGSPGEPTPFPAPQKLSMWTVYLNSSLAASSELKAESVKNQDSQQRQRKLTET